MSGRKLCPFFYLDINFKPVINYWKSLPLINESYYAPIYYLNNAIDTPVGFVFYLEGENLIVPDFFSNLKKGGLRTKCFSKIVCQNVHD